MGTPRNHTSRVSLWRGAGWGALCGGIVLVLFLNRLTGPLEDLIMTFYIVSTVFVGALIFPGPERSSTERPLIPNFGEPAIFVGYAAFVIVGAVIGLAVAWIVRRIRVKN